MKIVFLCSSLEPGRDGVGDYTRRLAAELIRQGHFSALVSLNDKYISEKVDCSQQSEDTNLPVLRLPETWPMKVKINAAKKYIDYFDPDWLSLQFVIFGFHNKGLPFGLAGLLAKLGTNRRWHIMFHELWLGMEVHSSVQNFLWGRVQKLLIKSLISTLNPEIIHTNTSLYKQQLSRLGFSAHRLPLFGNIPNVGKNAKGQQTTQFIENHKSINMVIFGSIFANAPVDDFASDAANYSQKKMTDLSLTIVGRCGTEQQRWAQKWIDAGMKVNIIGEQSESNISKVLGSASIGISTTPYALIEKSGSVAAMLEHGLPVICVPFPWQPRGFRDLKISPGISLYQKGNLESIFDNKFEVPVNNVSLITHKLTDALLKSA